MFKFQVCLTLKLYAKYEFMNQIVKNNQLT